MVWGLAMLEHKHWFHINFQLVISGRIDEFGGTSGYNGHKHHKLYTNGYSIAKGSSQV